MSHLYISTGSESAALCQHVHGRQAYTQICSSQAIICDKVTVLVQQSQMVDEN